MCVRASSKFQCKLAPCFVIVHLLAHFAGVTKEKNNPQRDTKVALHAWARGPPEATVAPRCRSPLKIPPRILFVRIHRKIIFRDAAPAAYRRLIMVFITKVMWLHAIMASACLDVMCSTTTVTTVSATAMTKFIGPQSSRLNFSTNEIVWLDVQMSALCNGGRNFGWGSESAGINDKVLLIDVSDSTSLGCLLEETYSKLLGAGPRAVMTFSGLVTGKLVYNHDGERGKHTSDSPMGWFDTKHDAGSVLARLRSEKGFTTVHASPKNNPWISLYASVRWIAPQRVITPVLGVGTFVRAASELLRKHQRFAGMAIGHAERIEMTVLLVEFTVALAQSMLCVLGFPHSDTFLTTPANRFFVNGFSGCGMLTSLLLTIRFRDIFVALEAKMLFLVPSKRKQARYIRAVGLLTLGLVGQDILVGIIWATFSSSNDALAAFTGLSVLCGNLITSVYVMRYSNNMLGALSAANAIQPGSRVTAQITHLTRWLRLSAAARLCWALVMPIAATPLLGTVDGMWVFWCSASFLRMFVAFTEVQALVKPGAWFTRVFIAQPPKICKDDLEIMAQNPNEIRVPGSESGSRFPRGGGSFQSTTRQTLSRSNLSSAISEWGLAVSAADTSSTSDPGSASASVRG